MRFVDSAIITITSGNGGKGSVSFRREKYIPKGGPNGGDGGDGGDLIFEASHNISSLLDFRYKPRYIAENGDNGRENNKKGKRGSNNVVMVPVGTTVTDYDSNEVIADLTRDEQKVALLRGGIGGKGNTFFKSSVNRKPRFSQPGTLGRTRKVNLTLKSLGDIGIIGLPNAGKSTLISKLTDSHPKIAPYPFTTKIPNLGVSYDKDSDKSLTLIDIPGIIKGASEGTGLGLRFLKHIERSDMLLHLIEIGSVKEIKGRYETVIKEIAEYNEDILKKTQIVTINKMDLIYDSKKLGKIRDAMNKYFAEKNIALFFISAYTGAGISNLKDTLNATVKKREICDLSKN